MGLVKLVAKAVAATATVSGAAGYRAGAGRWPTLLDLAELSVPSTPGPTGLPGAPGGDADGEVLTVDEGPVGVQARLVAHGQRRRRVDAERQALADELTTLAQEGFDAGVELVTIARLAGVSEAGLRKARGRGNHAHTVNGSVHVPATP